MKSVEERLYELLPRIYRVRDAEKGKPLKALISVIADEIAVIEDDLAQLYDNQFIETCAPWVAPYIGDLIGYRPLYGVVPEITSPRAEVANTIKFRRRKGTLQMLEELAHDVTDWHARIVEFFQRLATTQYMNHVRPENRSPDLRSWEPLEQLNTSFDSLAHTLDVRHISSGRGRYNIPNIGIFLWRLLSSSLTDVEAYRLDDHRYFFNPLAIDTSLFTRPNLNGQLSRRTSSMNVPDAISRRTLKEYLRDFYGAQKSLLVKLNDEPVDADKVVVCNLSDTRDGAWAHHKPPHGLAVGIDPELGRIVLRDAQQRPPRVTFHYAFSAKIGGGEYDRSESVPDGFLKKDGSNIFQIGVTKNPDASGVLVSTLDEAIGRWSAQDKRVGIIVIMDNSSYAASRPIDLTIPSGRKLLIIAADWPKDSAGLRHSGSFNATGRRPHIKGTLTVRGPMHAGGSDIHRGQLFLNGLLIEGNIVFSDPVPPDVSIAHCTLVPGPDPSLVVTDESLSPAGKVADMALLIEHSISGSLRIADGCSVEIKNSIIDAKSETATAFAAPTGSPEGTLPGATLRKIVASTIIGKVHTVELQLVSNTIFLASSVDNIPSVLSEKRQTGCVRFSFLPPNSSVPRRFQCQPGVGDAMKVRPDFTSQSYGTPGYAQLSQWCPQEIFSGADDEGEMGAFHDLYQPQRIANMRVRLEEYLGVRLEAGIIFET